MLFSEELKLLVQSKYPVIAVESTDEDYVVQQLQEIAPQLDLVFFQWSLTAGLQREGGEGAYYQTKDPVFMCKTIVSFLEAGDFRESLFVLKDFNRYLEDPLTARIFKDLIGLMKGTKNTVVLLAAEYKLPKDIEALAGHLVGGYPAQEEIRGVVWETISELKRTSQGMRMNFVPGEFKRIAKVLEGLSIQQIRSIIHQCVAEDEAFDINDLPAIEKYKKQIFDQEGLLEFCITEDKGNIAGFHNIKRWISDRSGSFSGAAHGLPQPKGVLLMGVQGCGKSLAIKVLARELNLHLYRLDLGRLYSKYIGETEQNLRKALAIVEKLCPLCLWIDEIEKGFASSGGDIDGGVSQRILGTFLTWMQERGAGCFVAATANNIYQLPPEFLRKGRFDEIFFVDLPDEAIRFELFKIHLEKRGFAASGFDCKALAGRTNDYSGAEIEQVIISALYRATSEKAVLTHDHLLEQIEATKPLAVLKAEEIARLREWARQRTTAA